MAYLINRPCPDYSREGAGLTHHPKALGESQLRGQACRACRLAVPGTVPHLNSASRFFISRILLCWLEMVRSWLNTSRVSAFCVGAVKAGRDAC